MCGIAGILGGADESLIKKMVSAQRHRGPDDQGIWVDESVPVALGHCRLSIIDLSNAAHQPMSYANGRLWITYNGEIFNYKELRTELIGRGHRFISDSDTEVILAAYSEWGRSCVKRFRGMFAFALLDKFPPSLQEPELLLVRDRLGIKPLLYFEANDKLFFSSELRALLQVECIERVIDQDSLFDYLSFGSVFQPKTIIKGVKSLPAGHYMAISGRTKKLVKYWDLHDETVNLRKELKDISYSEATERLRFNLSKAAYYNTISDVPVGAFLSGGIDSTAVVGLMSEISGQRIKTFSVGFEGKHSYMDERKYAGLAASYLGTEHQDIVVTSKDAVKIFQEIISDIDQPSFDGTNTWIVSREAKKSVKVALSGLGGDEIFAGYPHFRMLSNGVESTFSRQMPTFYKLLEKAHKIRPNRISLRLLFKLATPVERFSMLRRMIENYEFQSLVRPEFCHSFRSRLAGRFEKWLIDDADSVQKTSYVEVNRYLRSTLLRDGDVMSMAHGLEVRPMLLDHSLVEFAYSLPASYKLNGKETKRIFVSAVSNYLPEELKNRKKMGFELPITDWMSEGLLEDFETFLYSETARRIFTPIYLKRLSCRLRQGNPPRALWAWGILLSWLEKYQIRLI